MADHRTEARGMASGSPIISIRNLGKSFGSFVAVRDFSLDIHRGEVVSLLGPSGCGKTTTLRCIAGLEHPNHGEIEIYGNPVFSSTRGVQLPPEKRGLSMVFQQYALWPHMTVFENVAFALQVRRMPAAKVTAQAEEALRKVQLFKLRDRRISALSGGQQQRVALARALAVDPDIILFDEPLSNLDAKLREELRLELLLLQRELGFSAIYVTHDQEEAISLSSRIVIMNDGVCEQVGTPRAIWRDPATSFVARFIGSKNLLKGRVLERTGDGSVRVQTAAGTTLDGRSSTELDVGASTDIYIGLSDVILTAAPEGRTGNRFEGVVTLVSFQGESTLYELTLGSDRIVARSFGDARFSEGETVHCYLSTDFVRCYRPVERAG